MYLFSLAFSFYSTTMNTVELEKLKTSNEWKAAEELENKLNAMGFDPVKFVHAVMYYHRTLQQIYFRIVLESIKQFASPEYGYDLRNKGAHDAAKEIVDSGALEESYLPYI